MRKKAAVRERKRLVSYLGGIPNKNLFNNLWRHHKKTWASLSHKEKRLIAYGAKREH